MFNKNINPPPYELKMKKSVKKKLLKTKPVTDYLSNPWILADNGLERVFQQILFKKILQRVGYSKRCGDNLVSVMFTLLIWPLLGVKSISNFCGKKLSCFINGGENVLYDFMKRQDLNWRALRYQSIKSIYNKSDICREPIKAFVFDDTIKHRRGKKVEGSSWHFDHTEGRSVLGQQVLEMGLVASNGYLPIDSQIYISNSKAVYREKDFDDRRSAVALDYKDACNLNKNEMMRDMMKRALRAGIKAEYSISDSWFGNKGNIYESKKLNLTNISRMKCDAMKYRYGNEMYSDKLLYVALKKRARKVKGMPWKAFTITVELNFEEESGIEEDWHEVKLVFTLPKDEHCLKYGLFLCTDTELTAQKILEIYSLRWSIEVYFKEIKQNMGFLSEQTGNYVCHYASIHLSAIRYMMFAYLMAQDDSCKRLSDAKAETISKIELLCYANLLWDFFKALIHGALNKLIATVGKSLVDLVKATIDSTILSFLEEALQIDDISLKIEAKAEKKSKNEFKFTEELAATA